MSVITEHIAYLLPRSNAALLELTYNCNYSCSFCYLPWIDHPELYGKELNVSQWISKINLLVDDGVNAFLLTGGEPFLNPNLPTIVSHIRLNHPNCTVSIYTNGSIWNDELLSCFRGQGTFITTSLQSVSRYETMTGSETSFDDWAHFCKKVVSMGITLDIAITVTQRTLPELKTMIQVASRLGARQILVNPIVIEGRAKWHKSLWLSYDDHLKIRDIVNRMRKKSPVPIQVAMETHCICRRDATIPEGTPAEVIPTVCDNCHDLIVIGPDGRRRKCLHTYEAVPILLSGQATPRED